MFFNKKENKSNESGFVKVGALLIHAAKIDENYSKEEEEIIKKTLLSLGADKDKISFYASNLIPNKSQKKHYGDGTSSRKISSIISNYILKN